MTIRSPVNCPGIDRTNAIVCPSGDQAGFRAAAPGVNSGLIRAIPDVISVKRVDPNDPLGIRSPAPAPVK
jgi:hypothetical protein